MKELLEHIAKWLVEDPSQVNVTEIQGSTSVLLELSVAPDETGRVIGRGGRVANAIRTLLRAVAGRQGKRVTLDIIGASRNSSTATSSSIEESDTTYRATSQVDEAVSDSQSR